MAVLVFSSERFGEHMTPPGHPERYQRAQVMDAVAAAWRARGGAVTAPEPAAREALERVHDRHYLDRIAGLRGRSTMLDADTFTSPETHDVALLAAGAALGAVEHAMAGRGSAVAFVPIPRDKNGIPHILECVSPWRTINSDGPCVMAFYNSSHFPSIRAESRSKHRHQ